MKKVKFCLGVFSALALALALISCSGSGGGGRLIPEEGEGEAIALFSGTWEEVKDGINLIVEESVCEDTPDELGVEIEEDDGGEIMVRINSGDIDTWTYAGPGERGEGGSFVGTWTWQTEAGLITIIFDNEDGFSFSGPACPKL